MSTITVTNLQGHTSGGDANKVKLASGQTLDVNGTLDVTGSTITGNLPAANLTGALPAIDGSALTGVIAGTGAFAAGCSAAAWTTYNDGAIVAFDSDSGGDRFDTDNLFDTTTYKYQAPATGVYLFWYTVFTANSSAINGFGWLKNTSKLQFQQASTRMHSWWNGSTDDHIQSSTIVVPLTSGDTMAVCSTYSASDLYTGHSQWGGCRLA